MFDKLKVENVADRFFQDFLADEGVEGCVAEDVADGELSAGSSNGLFELSKFLLVRGERFFKQHVVTGFEKREGGRDVLMIHGAVDGEIREAGKGGECFCIFELAFGGDMEPLCRHLSAVRNRIGNPDDTELVGVMMSERGVDHGAVAGTHNYGAQGGSHWVVSEGGGVRELIQVLRSGG